MAIQLKTEDYRSVAGTSLTGALANVGAVTASPGRVIVLFNGCNAEVIVSWDGGTTEGFLLPASSAVAIDGPTNNDTQEVVPFLPVKSQFQAKHNGVAPTSGTLTITVVT